MPAQETAGLGGGPGKFLTFGGGDQEPGVRQLRYSTDVILMQVLAGRSFGEVRQAAPGVARYVTTLEVGYALHELTFAVLFAVIVLIPLRRAQRWAWWACWAVMIGNLGYAATIGRHDAMILARSLVAVLAVPVLLTACSPAVFSRRRAAGRP